MNHRSDRFTRNAPPCRRTRREVLWEVGGGFAGVALIDLLSRDGFFGATAVAGSSQLGDPVATSKPPHLAGKAKHCIFLFMNGAPSHVDTFDPKPRLAKFA